MPPNNPLHIRPNVPIYCALLDPQGVYDFDLQCGRYETTVGQILTLPRPAVIILNALEPLPCEELVITKVWSGRPGEPAHWTIALSSQPEKARALNEQVAATLSEQLERSVSAIEQAKGPYEAPGPIHAPAKRGPKPEVQPRLFDRGNGTHGPAPAILPAPLVVPRKAPPSQQIPANIAIREILAFLKADPSTANWSDQAIQDLASTVYISSVKQGHIGLWEREK